MVTLLIPTGHKRIRLPHVIVPPSACTGVWTGKPGTTTATQPAVKPTGTVGTHKTKLPTNHGTFATMTNYDTIEKIDPLDRSTERTIAIVSVLFTVATALAFLLALTCLFREKIRRICGRASAKKRTLSSQHRYFKKTRKIFSWQALLIPPIFSMIASASVNYIII